MAKEEKTMLKKSVPILIAVGILTIGITAFAQAEDQGKTIQTREQMRTTEQSQVEAEVQAGAPADRASGDMTMTQDRIRTQDQKKDGTGDMAQDRLRDRDHDRIHDHLGSGGAAGGGRGMSGGRGR
jgi:hypothetical protein